MLFLLLVAAGVVTARHPAALFSKVGVATPQNVSLDMTSCPGKLLMEARG